MSLKLSKRELLDHVLSAIEDSGGSYRLISDNHPFMLYAFDEEGSERLRIYIWNITHGGGRARAANEYRVQITGVDSIDITPPLKTLLLGYDPRYKVFAGYNASRYQTFGASPSLQVKEEFLAQAAREGFAVQPKEIDSRNGDVTEIAVAFAPEQFLTYAFNLEAYHELRISERELRIIQRAASNRPIQDADMTILPEARKRAIKQFNMAIRNKKFRKAVLEAYGQKCAICGIQLKLVEAAHIVPVKNNGTDEIINGIALCPNHHKAFDQGLVLIGPENQVLIITKKVNELRRRRLHGGLEGFQTGLGNIVTLPSDSRYRPSVDYIRERLRLESWQQEL